MSKAKTPFTNTLLLFSERGVVLALSFINTVLMARLTDKSFFGEFNHILAYCALFLPFTVLGLNNLLSRCFVRFPAQSHYFMRMGLILRVLGASIAAAFGTLLFLYLNPDSVQWHNIFILLVLQGFNAVALIEFYFLSQHIAAVTAKVRLMALLLSGAMKLVAILCGASLTTLIVLHGLEFVLVALGYIWLYQRAGVIKSTSKPSRKWALFNKSKWLLLSGLASVIYLKIDQVMLANMVGLDSVANYAVAVRLSEFWYVFPVIAANSFFPWLAKQPKGRMRDQAMQQLLRSLIFAAVLIALLTALLGEWLIVLVFGEAYRASAAILSVHVFAGIFVFQRAILSKWLILENLLKFSLLSHGLGAVCNVLLNWWLIPLYGGLGAAWASLAAYFFASIGCLLLSARTRPFFKITLNAMLSFPLGADIRVLKRIQLREAK